MGMSTTLGNQTNDPVDEIYNSLGTCLLVARLFIMLDETWTCATKCGTLTSVGLGTVCSSTASWWWVFKMMSFQNVKKSLFYCYWCHKLSCWLSYSPMLLGQAFLVHRSNSEATRAEDLIPSSSSLSTTWKAPVVWTLSLSLHIIDTDSTKWNCMPPRSSVRFPIAVLNVHVSWCTVVHPLNAAVWYPTEEWSPICWTRKLCA